jgi:hypothetical protein
MVTCSIRLAKCGLLQELLDKDKKYSDANPYPPQS